MYILLQDNNNSRRRIPIHLVDGTDGITAKTGQTGTAQISTNYGTPKTSKNSLVEIDSTNLPGDYYIELDISEVATLGNLLVRVKTSASAEYVYPVQVVAFDPYQPISLQPGFNSSILAGADVDYKRIQKLIAEEIGKIPAPERPEPPEKPEKVNLQPVLEAIRGLREAFDSQQLPEAKETDLKPVMARFDAVEQAIRGLKFPETDLKPVLDAVREAGERASRDVAGAVDALKQLSSRMVEFFGTDVEEIKTDIRKITQKLSKSFGLVMSKPEEGEESND